MKKTLITAATLLFAVCTFSQPLQGKFFISGNLSLYMMKNKSRIDGTIHENITSTAMTLLPGAGYFIGDRIAVGTYLGVSGSIAKDPDPGIADPSRYSDLQFVVSPFFRYYLFSGRLGMFAEATVDGGFGKIVVEYQGGSYEYPQMSLSAGISPVVYYYASERIALEGRIGWIGYEHESYTDEDDNKDISNGFGIDLYPAGFVFGMIFIL